MSTSKEEEDGLAQLRREAFPYLPGSEFDDALNEAREYHKMHPPEDCIVGPNLNLRDRRAQHQYTATTQATLNTLAEEHRTELAQCFQKRGVPLELAHDIVRAFILVD